MASRPIAPPIQLTQRGALVASLLAGGIAALIVLWLTGSAAFAAGFVGAAIVLAGAAITWRSLAGSDDAAAIEVDWGLARAVAQTAADAIAITDRAGRLVCANDRYEALFGGFPAPPDLPLGDGGAAGGARAGRAA